MLFWWNKKKVYEICFPLLLENLNWLWPWIICCTTLFAIVARNLGILPVKQKSPHHTSSAPLLLMNNIKMNGMPSKIWWKMQPLFVLYFKFYSNSYKHKISHQIFYFLLFYVSFYTSRHHFSQIIRTSFTIIWKKKKKDFSPHLSFFNRFPQTPAPP